MTPKLSLGLFILVLLGITAATLILIKSIIHGLFKLPYSFDGPLKCMLPEHHPMQSNRDFCTQTQSDQDRYWQSLISDTEFVVKVRSLEAWSRSIRTETPLITL